MLSCWRQNPDERRCFSDIVDILNDIIEPLAGYIDFTTFFVKNENHSIRMYDYFFPTFMKYDKK